MRQEIHFILNNEDTRTRVAPGMLVLDYLRQRARLMGTKEGCREGDCGACTVLHGHLDGAAVDYRPVTSCLLPMGELHGQHLVTIEGLNLPGLNPAQQAIVDQGATQCGFCTPGIAVSLTGYLMQPGELTNAGIRKALSGHLCRCTGYRSLKACGAAMADTVGVDANLQALMANGHLPDYFGGIPDRLRQIPPLESEAADPAENLIAGGTDLYIQQEATLYEGPVGILAHRAGMRGIAREGDHLRVGALTTFEEFGSHPAVAEIVPHIEDHMQQIGSWQIRNRATLGGNIVNASPIADLTILLLALEAKLVLASGDNERTLPLRAFYKGYKDLDLGAGEILKEIHIPLPANGSGINFEKVAKRKTLDIASVNSALQVGRTADGTIASATLAFGGVAPIPRRMERTEAALIGNPVSAASVLEAIDVAQGEIAPISDIRGSAGYKRLLVRQLMIAHFTTLFPDEVNVRECYAAN